jgi:hypothetical protein
MVIDKLMYVDAEITMAVGWVWRHLCTTSYERKHVAVTGSMLRPHDHVSWERNASDPTNS